MKTSSKIALPNSRIKISQRAPVKRKTGYETLTEAIQDLTSQGYTRDFNIIANEDCLQCHKTQLKLSPNEFDIDAIYRFEGDSDPGDEMIVFAISSTQLGIKGIVVNAFGTYADGDSSEIVEKLLKKGMTKKTPIKRHKALIQLSRDHHFGLLLVWKIRQGLKKNIEPERISRYIQFFFEEDLQDHFREEERNLFSKLPQNDPLSIQAYYEHNLIYKQVNEIKADPKNYDLLQEFADILEKHIRFEERTLFNYLQTKLSEEELTSLISENKNNNTDLDDRWEDHFWAYKE